MAKVTKKEEVSEVCLVCKGRGRVDSTPIASITCDACKGTGVVK